MDRHHETQTLAYRLWEDEGRPHGRDWDHWFRAEETLSQRLEETVTSAVAEPTARVEATPSRRSTARRGRKMQ